MWKFRKGNEYGGRVLRSFARRLRLLNKQVGGELYLGESTVKLAEWR